MRHFERKIYLPVIVGSLDREDASTRRLIVRIREPGGTLEYRVVCYLTDQDIVEARDLRALLAVMLEDLVTRWERRSGVESHDEP